MPDDEIGRVVAPQMIRGVATLTGITAVPISVPQILDTSVVLIGVKTPRGTVGLMWTQNQVAGTGFQIVSVALNTSDVSWVVLI